MEFNEMSYTDMAMAIEFDCMLRCNELSIKNSRKHWSSHRDKCPIKMHSDMDSD